MATNDTESDQFLQDLRLWLERAYTALSDVKSDGTDAHKISGRLFAYAEIASIVRTRTIPEFGPREWASICRRDAAIAQIDACEHKRTIKTRGDEAFLPRMGCLDCDCWLEPPKLRDP